MPTVARANPLAPRARGKQFLSCSQTVKRVIWHSHSLDDSERAPCQVNLARTITGDFLAELRGGVHLPVICHTEDSMAPHTIPDAVLYSIPGLYTSRICVSM